MKKSNDQFDLNNLANKELADDFYKSNAKLDPHQAKRHKFVNFLVTHSKKEKALDIGCGYGDITNTIANHFDSIIGVDIIFERVESACKEFSNSKYLVSNATNLPFNNNSFDTILSIVIINWFEQVEEHFSAVHCALKTEGDFILMVQSPEKLRNKIRKILKKGPAGQDARYEFKIIKKLLEEGGFTIKKTAAFYEPLSESTKSIKGIMKVILAMPMRVMNSLNYADYYGIVATKKST